jgi:hypothetical protein
MKWKHKQTGWDAYTMFYEMPDGGVRVTYEVGGAKVSFNLPTKLVEVDENWEEVDDDRWLNLKLTAREFMETFAMTIDPGGRNHDSLVMKTKIDKMFVFRDEATDNDHDKGYS